MSERAGVCREILEHVARVERLRAIREELRAMEQFALASGINRGIRLEHWAINRLQQQLGLSPFVLARDAAAFARAQLGLPIDAPPPHDPSSTALLFAPASQSHLPPWKQVRRPAHPAA